MELHELDIHKQVWELIFELKRAHIKKRNSPHARIFYGIKEGYILSLDEEPGQVILHCVVTEDSGKTRNTAHTNGYAVGTLVQLIKHKALTIADLERVVFEQIM